MESTFQYKARTGLILLFILTLALLAHHFWAYVGHFAFDDILYARLSQQVQMGVFRVTDDHYTFRWGLIWLNGQAYKIFGMNDHSSALTPLMATVLTGWLVWILSAGLSILARGYAMAFTLLSQWVFFYSDKIMPDTLVMFATTAALASIHVYRYGAWQNYPKRAALALVVSLSVCFLCKETVILSLPLFAWWLLADLIRGKNKVFWAWSFGLGVLSAVLYLSIICSITGEWMGRAIAIQANSYFNPCSYEQLPIEHLMHRIKSELWRIFFTTGVAVGWVFILPLLFRKNIKNLFLGSTSRDFLVLNGFGLLLLSNFMTTSLTHYIPLCPDIRHFLFAIPFTGLAAAVGLADFIEKPLAARHWIACGLSVLAAVLAWKFEPEQVNLYGSLALVVGLAILAKKRSLPMAPSVFWMLFIAVLLWKPAYVFKSARVSNYTVHQNIIQAVFDPKVVPQNLLVISNKAEKNLDQYFLKFDTTGATFIKFEEVSLEKVAAADSIALIINGTTAWLSGLNWESMPFWVIKPDASRTLIDTARYIEIYGLNKSDLLQRLQAGQ